MKQIGFKQKQKGWITLNILLLIFFLTQTMRAQVTIGSGNPPHADALLDLKENSTGSSSKGLLLPRVSLSGIDSPSPLSTHVEGMFVFNTSSAGSGSTTVTPGMYYNTGNRWEKVNSAFSNWFYMPSIVFDTSSTGSNLTKNLYQLYAGQFSTPKYKSIGSPSSVPYLPNAGDLYYYITDYDQDVFEIVSLTDQGILTYNVKQAASAYTQINIVFVLK